MPCLERISYNCYCFTSRDDEKYDFPVRWRRRHRRRRRRRDLGCPLLIVRVKYRYASRIERGGYFKPFFRHGSLRARYTRTIYNNGSTPLSPHILHSSFVLNFERNKKCVTTTRICLFRPLTRFRVERFLHVGSPTDSERYFDSLVVNFFFGNLFNVA